MPSRRSEPVPMPSRSRTTVRVISTPCRRPSTPCLPSRVAGRIPIILDGGVRRGTDVLKAIAFGASAVMIGRPYVYALATGGAEGVAHCVNLLRRDFELAMVLTGRARIGEID